MRRADPEDEAVIPRISPTHFTKEKSAREMELNGSSHDAMLRLRGSWKIIGWALADDVAPRDLCQYVILCERSEESLQAWCHCTNYTIEHIAEKVRQDPTKIMSLR